MNAESESPPVYCLKRDSEELAAELRAMKGLQDFSCRLLVKTELQPLLEEALDAVIALQNADFGNIQFYDPKTEALQIVTQRGFGHDCLDYFKCVKETGAACGRGLLEGERVIIEDVLSDPGFEPHRSITASAGFRAVQSRPLFSHSGEPIGMISIHFRQPHRPSERQLRFTDLYGRLVADLIERKRAEESLRKTHARLEMVLDSITDKFFAVDAQWRYTYFNNQAEEQLRVLGKDPASLIGKVLWDEFPDAPSEEPIRRAMAERVPITFEHYYPPLGEWVENRIYPNPDGGLAMFVSYITGRKRAEEKLRRSEAFLAEGQKISHTGTWTVKFPSGEVFWSQEVFRIYGLDPATTKLSLCMAFDLIHPEDRVIVQQSFERALCEKCDYDLEHRAILPDGTLKHLHALGHPVLDESGAIVEYIGTVIDITERKRVQAELQKAQAELAHVTRLMSMGELAASIAHEINQPLGAIANNASACSRLLSGAPQEARNALRDIVQDANRASAIIARVRSLTKGSIPEKVSVDVKDIIGDVLALAQRQLSERELTVQTEFAQGLPLVLGDRVELQQVFLNLIMNAMEAMEGLGAHRRSMIVSARHHELEGCPAVLVSIQDVGIGFKPRTAEHLFEPFFTTKPGGLGMGLRISRSIIEAHGGRIWAKTNDDQGATFSCALPAAVLDQSPV